jgi:hypothetical protein
MVFPFIPTGSWKFVKPPQIIEETSFGVPPASPVLQLIGNVTEIVPNPGVEKESNRTLGTSLVVSQSKLMNTDTSTITFKIWPSLGPAFLKRVMNEANPISPAGNNGSSFTLVYSQLVDNAEKYTAFVGTKISTGSLEVSKDGGAECTAEMQSYRIYEGLANLSSIGITTPTFKQVSDYPAELPWSSLTGGVDPFTLNAVAVPTDRIKFDVNHNLVADSPNGSDGVEFLEASLRDVTIDFDTWYKNTALFDYLRNQTIMDATYKLQASPTPAIIVTVDDIQMDSREITHPAAEAEHTKEGMVGTAKNMTIA